MKRTLLIWLCLGATAQAAIKVVASNGTSGSAGTLANPWSLAYACSTAVADDTMWMRALPGDYTVEMHTFGSIDYIMHPLNDGTAGHPIVWRNYPGEARPRIKGDTLYSGGTGPLTNGIELSGTRYHEFDSIRVSHCQRRAVQINGAAQYKFRNCLFDTVGIADGGGNNPGAFSADLGQTDTGLVEDCFFDRCTASGIFFECGVDSFVIRRNTFKNCETAVFIKLSTEGRHGEHIHIYDNVIYKTVGAPNNIGQNAVAMMGSYRNIDIYIHHNLIYGPFRESVFWFSNTDVYDILFRHDRVYIYNNTIDCYNQTAGFVSIWLADTLQTDEAQSLQFLFDTVQIFNNIAYTPDVAGGTGAQPGYFSFFGKMTYVGAGITNGVGRVGQAFMNDYNLIYDTSGGSIIYWIQAQASGGSWIAGSGNFWTHAQMVANLPLWGGTLAGDGSNDKLANPAFADFVNYEIIGSSPAASGGRGVTMFGRDGVTLELLDYFGYYKPADPTCPTAASISPSNGVVIAATQINIVANFIDDNVGNDYIVKLYGEVSDATPDVLLFTDTLTADSSGWTFNWTGLLEDSTYYWMLTAEDLSCTDSSGVSSFTIDSITAPATIRDLRGTPVTGTKLGVLDETYVPKGRSSEAWPTRLDFDRAVDIRSLDSFWNSQGLSKSPVSGSTKAAAIGGTK